MPQAGLELVSSFFCLTSPAAESVIVCHKARINVDKLLLLIILDIERLLWGKLKCSSVEKCPGLMQ